MWGIDSGWHKEPHFRWRQFWGGRGGSL